jgi:hypothetical protein
MLAMALMALLVWAMLAARTMLGKPKLGVG